MAEKAVFIRPDAANEAGDFQVALEKATHYAVEAVKSRGQIHGWAVKLFQKGGLSSYIMEV